MKKPTSGVKNSISSNSTMVCWLVWIAMNQSEPDSNGDTGRALDFLQGYCLPHLFNTRIVYRSPRDKVNSGIVISLTFFAYPHTFVWLRWCSSIASSDTTTGEEGNCNDIENVGIDWMVSHYWNSLLTTSEKQTDTCSLPWPPVWGYPISSVSVEHW